MNRHRLRNRAATAACLGIAILSLAAAVGARADDAEGAAADACPPGAPLADEEAPIRALPEALRRRFLVPDCPAVGCAGDSAQQQRINRAKARVRAPDAAEIDPAITLAAMLAPAKDDRERFRTTQGARIRGYVRHVWQGGVESGNCRVTDVAIRDTHIDLYIDTDPKRDGTERVIVEITPRTRALAAARGLDWSTAALKRDLVGHWVEVSGWMFFDEDHCNETANTRTLGCGGPGGEVWRRTGWEVHPVTDLRVDP